MILIEFICLETASLSIDMIVRKRRLMYLHHILHSPENELISKVYTAQSECPVPGNWVIQICDDRKILNFTTSDTDSKLMTKYEYKNNTRK